MEQSKTNTPRGAAKLNRLIDFNSYPLNMVLRILLKDRTTGENIIWATDNYSHLGNTYHSAATMRLKDLVKLDKSVIQPRVYKTLELQKQRTKVNAEVFTPSWICCLMNNHLDDVWFNRKDVFNKMDGQKWRASNRKIEFPTSGSKTWMGYVDSRRLEITCGEAPYLVSRYDTTTGKVLDLTHRIGILDRKLRVVNENTGDETEWMKWVLRAYQSTYGYEYQGDNLLIARINLLMTFCDYMQARWDRNPTEDELKAVAFVISWNIWQMNGLTYKTSYDADADRKRLQEIIDDCDEMLRFYDKHLNPPGEDDGTYTPDEIQMIESMLANKKNELTMDELIEIVKQEDLRELATMYADYHGIRIIDGDVPDYSAELAKLRQEMVVDRNEVQLLRDETYAEQHMIIDAPDCLIKNWRMRRTECFRDIAQKSKGKGIMKFDFAIGNPPYQEGHKQLYPDFYKSAQKISNCVEMIFPSAWQDPKDANNLRKLNNKETKEDEQIVFINNVHNVFNGITGADWTNIILWKKGYNNGLNGEQLVYTNGLNPQTKLLLMDKKQVELDPILANIKNRVVTDIFHSLVNIMHLQNKYNLATMLQDHPECETQISCGKDKRIRSNAFDKVSLFSDVATSNSIKIYGLSKSRRIYKYIDIKYIEINVATYKYKVLMPVAAASGVFGSVLSPFEVCEPNIGYTETFMAIGAFDEKQDADNCFKYLKTKFVRTMLGMLKTNQNGKREVWNYVPLQDFTSSSDIDWTKSIPEIDQQLYKKYGLSQEEIDFIESKVKEMA